MICMKHPTLGNSYFDEWKEAELTAQGWVRWPRTAVEKAAERAAQVDSLVASIPVFAKPAEVKEAPAKAKTLIKKK